MGLAFGKALFVLGAAVIAAPLAMANTVPAQKGNQCDAVWQLADGTATANANSKKPWELPCVAGSECDSDANPANGCQVNVEACVGSTEIEGCTPAAGTFKAAGKAKKFGVQVPSAAGCGATTTVPLTLRKNGQKASKPAVLILKGKKFKNAVKITCLPGGTTTTTLPPTGDCARESGLPNELILVVPSTGADLDNGYSGASHNFPVTSQSTLRYCLSNCDADTDPTCDMAGSVGVGTPNGPTFGAPLPLLAANVPVCLVNRFREGSSLTGTINLQTGEFSNPVLLSTDVYIRLGNDDNVCPRCVNNRCTGNSKNDGAQCTVNGTATAGGSNYDLSSDCQPAGNPVTLQIDLPLVSGRSDLGTPRPKPCDSVGQQVDDNCQGGTCTVDCSPFPDQENKGGINQLCCSTGSQRLPCFPTSQRSIDALNAAGRGDEAGVVRNGTIATLSPAWGAGATYPLKTAAGAPMKGAATFCIPATGSATIDSVTGLPAPGALILPADATVNAR